MPPCPELLLDKNFIADYFSRKITKPEYASINWHLLNITPIKATLNNHYHLVLRYDVEQISQPIFCSAHAIENRLNAYRALKFIDENMKNEKIKPLFFTKHYNALFYLGSNGENIQYYIKKGPEKIGHILKLTAKWLVELHQIKINPQKHNFNSQSSRLETIIPGAATSLKIVKERTPEFFEEIKSLLSEINRFDQKDYPENGHYLIHGDLHPENIIYDPADPDYVVVIDYTDVCVADFTRDLACFFHQLNYMVNRFNPKHSPHILPLQKIFLDAYLKEARLELTFKLKERIRYYAAWAALRNAIFFLIKGFIEKDEARKSLKSACDYLNQKL